MAATIRHPAVAGRFYPNNPNTLKKDLHSYLSTQATPTPALGCVTPHAGYMYSGAVAGAVFANLDLPRRLVVLGPNHTGKGRPLAIMSSGSWETPLGQAPIDSSLAEDLKKDAPSSAKTPTPIAGSTPSKWNCRSCKPDAPTSPSCRLPSAQDNSKSSKSWAKP